MKSNSCELQGLVIARDGVPLTSPINIILSSGEILAIHGRNGAGKSTLLRTMAGLLPPLSGSIRFNGAWPIEQPLLYLGHKRGLSLDMSVYENVALWARLSHTPELISAALHYFELSDIADIPLNKLSAGWQQRVALTRLITHRSNYWLLDEPAANLDAYGTELLQSLMQARLEQGGIIAIATHTALQGDMIKTIKISKLN